MLRVRPFRYFQGAGGDGQAVGGRAAASRQTGARTDYRSPQQTYLPPQPLSFTRSLTLRGGNQIWGTHCSWVSSWVCVSRINRRQRCVCTCMKFMSQIMISLLDLVATQSVLCLVILPLERFYKNVV